MNIISDVIILAIGTICLLLCLFLFSSSKNAEVNNVERIVKYSEESIIHRDIEANKFDYLVSKNTETYLDIQPLSQLKIVDVGSESSFVLDNKPSALGHIFGQITSLEGEIKSHIQASAIEFTDIRPRETEALLDELEQRLRENNW